MRLAICKRVISFLSRNIYFSFFARGMLVLVSLLSFKILTIKLSAEEVGKWSLLIMIVSLFSMTLINPVAMYLNRHFHRWYDEGKLIHVMNWLVFLYVLIGILAVGMLSVMVSFVEVGWTEDYFILLCLVGAGVFINNLNLNTVYYINMLGNQKTWFYLSMSTLILALILSVILTNDVKSVELWMIGQYFGYLVSGILAYYVIRKLFLSHAIASQKIIITKASISKLMRFSFPLLLAVGLYWLQFQSYRIFIADSFSLAYLGMFIAGYTVSTGIMGAFESVLQQFFHPIFYSRVNKGDASKLNNGMDIEIRLAWIELNKISIPLILLTTITIAILSKPLIHILVAEKFWDGWYFVVLGAFVEMCRVMGNIYGLIFHAINKTKMLLVPHFVGALSVIITMPLMINRYGSSGIGLSLVVSSLLYLAVLRKVASRYIKMSGTDYNHLKIILYVLCLMVILLIYELFDYSLVVDILSILVVGLVYVYTLYIFSKSSKLIKI